LNVFKESSRPPDPPLLPTPTDLLLTQLNKRDAGFSSSKTGQDPRISLLKQSPERNSNVPKPPSPEKNHKGLVDFLVSAL
jgi:hypothetical protein